MKKKYNFRINFSDGTVSINVSTLVFPKPIILHAAYHFIEAGKVIVEKAKNNQVAVTLIPDGEIEESDLEELGYEFNIQLISSFVENIESERHLGLREEMMRAALSPQFMSSGLKARPQDMSSVPHNASARSRSRQSG
jgi:hypothetical protein